MQTGSLRPWKFRVSDAAFNLGVSIGVLNSSTKLGVFIAMNGKVLPVDKSSTVQRDKSTGLFFAAPRHSMAMTTSSSSSSSSSSAMRGFTTDTAL